MVLQEQHSDAECQQQIPQEPEAAGCSASENTTTESQPTDRVMPNTHRRRRRDETVLSRRVGVGGVYMNSQLAHDNCRLIRSTIWKLAKQTVSVSVSVSV